MQEVIKVEQLTKSYNKLLAVSNVSFSVSRGTAFGLFEQTVQEKAQRLNVF